MKVKAECDGVCCGAKTGSRSLQPTQPVVCLQIRQQLNSARNFGFPCIRNASICSHVFLRVGYGKPSAKSARADNSRWWLWGGGHHRQQRQLLHPHRAPLLSLLGGAPPLRGAPARWSALPWSPLGLPHHLGRQVQRRPSHERAVPGAADRSATQQGQGHSGELGHGHLGELGHRHSGELGRRHSGELGHGHSGHIDSHVLN